MRTNRSVLGHAVKKIDFAYMSQLKRIFRPTGLNPQCRWQGCENPELKEGDFVVSKLTTAHSRLNEKARKYLPPIWHEKCFEGMFL